MRRNVEPPDYLITRSSRFPEHLNPWTQRDRLPRMSGGLLGELVYGNQPVLSMNDPPYDKNGKVDSSDVTIAQTHGTSNATGLKMLALSAGGPFAPQSSGDGASADASDAATSGVAFALAGVSTTSTPGLPALPSWIAVRLAELDLNRGSIAKYVRRLEQEHTADGRTILTEAKKVADALGLDDQLLETLLGRWG